jgi:hypothetical protein
MQMKAKYMIYSFTAAMTLLLSACVEEKIEKGAPDPENCMGVYFVQAQENLTDHTLEKGKDDKTLEFIVRRTNVESEADVTFNVEAYTIVKDETYTDTSYCEVLESADDLFEFGEIYFKEGQKETTLKVWFDDIEIGKKYTCRMSITDPLYVSQYAENSSSVTFTVQMFDWKKIGKATYRDALFSDMFSWEGRYLETEVDIYERTDAAGKGYYKLENVYSAEYIARLVEGDEAFNEDPTGLTNDYKGYIDNASIIVNATNPDKVYIPVQKTGFSDPSMGDIMIASDVTEVWGASSNLLYGTLSEDKVITFPKNGLLISLGQYFYFSNISGKTRIVLPGGKAEDYVLELTAGEINAESKIPVTFKPSKDVKTVKYAIFEGKVGGLEVDEKINLINSGKTEVHQIEVKEEKTIEISMSNTAKTDFYTLIACTYAPDGTYKEYASTVLGYVKPGDERDVNLSFNVIVDDHFASDKEHENYSSENSFQYWVRGKDITHAMFNYYSLSYYNSYQEKIEDELKKSGSIDNSMLKILNEGGLSGVVGNNLKPGTEYIFVVYAGNGYHSEFKTMTFKTAGEEDILQKSYWYKDFMTTARTAEDYTSHSWYAVSIDVFDSNASDRTIRGNGRKVTFSYNDGKMTASGLFPALNVKLDNGKIQNDPSIVFDYTDGFLYSTENDLDDVVVKDSTHIVPSMRFEHRYTPRVGSISGSGYFYDTYEDENKVERYDMITAGFVHDQIIAFTDNRTTFSFWALLLGGYQMYSDGPGLANFIGDAHGDLILVREDCPLLAKLQKSESQSAKVGEKLSSVTESNRVDMPAIGTILKDIKKADVAYDQETRASEIRSLLDIREDARIKTIVK